MRRTLVALAVVGLPFGAVAATAAPASAQQCQPDDPPASCLCPVTAKLVNGVSRKVTGQDAVACTQ